METIHIFDLEARVLSKDEREEAVTILHEDVNRRVKPLKGVTIKTPFGDYSGNSIFYTAQTFAETVDALPLQENARRTLLIVDLVDGLAGVDPEFYELPHINGKNILAALANREDHAIKNRILGAHAFESQFCDEHRRANAYLERAVDLFDKFRRGIKPTVGFYHSYMIGSLASSHKREAEFLLKLSKDVNFLEYDKRQLMDRLGPFGLFLGHDDHAPVSPQEVLNALAQYENTIKNTLSERSFRIFRSVLMGVAYYNSLFKMGVFSDRKHLSVELANYADTLKFFSHIPLMRERAITYLNEARKTLGDDPRIIETLNSLRKK